MVSSPSQYFMDNLSVSSIEAEYYQKILGEFSRKTKNSKRPKNRPQLTNKAFADQLIQRIKSGNDSQAFREDYMPVMNTIKLENFQVVLMNGKEYLQSIIGRKIKTILPWENSFDIVWQMHKDNNHPTTKELFDIMKNEYILINLSVECIIQVCPVCLGEDKSNRRCALELIDLESRDYDFNQVMAYQDLYTGFIRLRPITSDSMNLEITMELLKILMDFGPPSKIIVSNPILDSAIAPIKEMVRFLDINVIQVEPDNGRVICMETMIHDWMKDNDCRNWGFGCHMLQWQLNNECTGKHSISPYARVFKSFTGNKIDDLCNREQQQNSTEANVGVSTDLTSDELVTVSDEEDPLAEDAIMGLQEPYSKNMDTEPISPKPGPSRQGSVAHVSSMDLQSQSESFGLDKLKTSKKEPISPVSLVESNSSDILSDDDV